MKFVLLKQLSLIVSTEQKVESANRKPNTFFLKSHYPTYKYILMKKQVQVLELCHSL